MERLDKYLSSAGVCSRREAKLMIKAGRVTLDGVCPAGPEVKVGEGVQVAVDGKVLSAGGPVYLMLHKPAGVISSTDDPREETVLSLLPEELRRQGVFPVGRLDKDTEGLLLLTNDGPLAHELLSPKKHVDKVYYARVNGTLEDADVAAFRAGLTLGDGTVCQAAELKPLGEGAEALVTLREGKYHQVKRMLASRGKPVTYLKRLSMGGLSLDEGLAPGQWRYLTEPERAILGR